MFKDEESQKFLTDKVPQEKLANAKKLADVNPDDYAAIFYVGGHGPVIDLATDPTNVKLASKVSLLLVYASGEGCMLMICRILFLD